MAEKHIISAFDEDIEKIQSTLMKMGGLVEKSLFDAAAALVKSDIELARKVKEHDQVIDSLNGVAIDSMDTAGHTVSSFAVPCLARIAASAGSAGSQKAQRHWRGQLWQFPAPISLPFCCSWPTPWPSTR